MTAKKQKTTTTTKKTVNHEKGQLGLYL